MRLPDRLHFALRDLRAWWDGLTDDQRFAIIALAYAVGIIGGAILLSLGLAAMPL